MSEKIIQLNEEAVKTELKELVRKSVEDTLNELLNKEAEEALMLVCARLRYISGKDWGASAISA